MNFISIFTISRKQFIKILNLVKSIDDECRIELFNDRLEIIHVDPANISLIHVVIPKLAFKSYSPHIESNFNVQLTSTKSHSKSLLKLLNLAKWDFVSLVEIEDLRTKWECGDVTFYLSQPEVRARPRLPNIEFNVDFKIKTNELFSDLKLIGEMSEYVEFNCSDSDKISLMADDINIDLTNKIQVESTQMCKTLQSIEVLSAMSTFQKFASTVKISFSDEFPIVIEAVGENNEVIRYLQAPRIESD